MTNRLRMARLRGEYPKGVVMGNLYAVWDLRTTAGLSQSVTKRTSIDGTPPGWSHDVTPSLYYSPTTSFTLSRWAVDSGQALAQGPVGGTFSDVYFNNPGSGSTQYSNLATAGYNSTGGTYVYSHCEFDGTGMEYWVDPSTGSAAFVNPIAGTTVSFDNCRFNHAPLLNLKTHADSLTMTDCFVGTFGYDPKNTVPLSHMENVFFDTGVVVLRRVCVDSSAYNSDPTEVYTTALVVAQTNASETTIYLTMEDCIVNGAMTQGDGTGLPYPIFLSARYAAGKDVHLIISGCAIQKGQIGYISVEELLGGQVTIVDGGGNYDLDTGALLDLSYP